MDLSIKQFQQCLHTAPGKRLALVSGCALAVLAGLFILGKSPAPVELDRHHPLDMSSLKLRWAQGDMIVLVRHLERCDHTAEPCLSGTSGITRRAVDVASVLGTQFRQLGLANTDVLNSPIERAQQSASFIFGTTSSAADWLATCKKTMNGDVFAHKQAKRNLILITHSECIADLEQAMHLKPITLDYGTSLFISADPAASTPQVLGYIDSDDWQEAMGQ